MARLDVYDVRNGSPGYLLDVQANMLDRLSTRIVVPLLPVSHLLTPISSLHPRFEINDEMVVMVTHQLGAISARQLRRPVASLISEHETITRALDLLLVGF